MIDLDLHLICPPLEIQVNPIFIYTYNITVQITRQFYFFYNSLVDAIDGG